MHIIIKYWGIRLWSICLYMPWFYRWLDSKSGQRQENYRCKTEKENPTPDTMHDVLSVSERMDNSVLFSLRIPKPN